MNNHEPIENLRAASLAINSVAPTSQGVLYHYATQGALDSILEKGTIRATDARFLNDASEIEYGIKLLSKIGEQITSKDFNPFTVSFCSNRDSYFGWTNYAKESGIAIGLDFSIQESTALSIECEKEYVEDGKSFFEVLETIHPLKILYMKENASISSIRRIYNSAITKSDGYIPSKEFKKKIKSMIVALVKREEFGLEEEYRHIIVPIRVKEKKWKSLVRFADSKLYLKPYINLSYSYFVDEMGNREFGLPICSICTGPSSDQKRAFQGIISRVEYGKVKSIPINKWIFLNRLNEFIQKLFEATGDDTYNSKIKSERIIKKFHQRAEKKEIFTKEESNKIISDTKNKAIKSVTTKKDVEKFLDSNYFSNKGIHIYKSDYPYRFR